MADADWANYKQLRGVPLPLTVNVRGVEYRFSKLLKWDFYANVGRYDRVEGEAGSGDSSDLPGQVLVKVYHTDPWAKLPLAGLGRWLCRREALNLERLVGIDGVPQLLMTYGAAGMIREFIPGCDLREYSRTRRVDEDFFPRLKRILAAVHARGVSHNDLSKPENVLVTPDGAPALIDFQIAGRIRRHEGWFQFLFSPPLVRFMQKFDTYHLAKQHRRRRPMDFTPEQLAQARRKGVVLHIHAVARRPYRAIRHRILKRFLTVDA